MHAVFLDLDGTLLDPKIGITQSIQYALDQMGQDIPTADELEWCIGPPLHHSLSILLGEGADIEAALDAYREHYSNEAMYDAEPYDGLEEMFEGFLTVDMPLFIATSKPQVYAEKIADHFGLMNYIQAVYGSDLDVSLADKSDLLAHALSETEADPARSIMIGDRKFDIFGAKNNHMLNIGALWGYGQADELRQAEADMLAGHPSELPELCFDLLGYEA